MWSPSNGGSGTTNITASPNGGSFLAVDPSYQNGMLSQTLTSLVTGATYTVSFYAAAAQQQGISLAGSGYSSINNTWSLLRYHKNNVLTATTVAPTISINDKAFSGWVQQSLSFMATSSQMTLSFLASTNVTSGQPPFALLDGVSVTQNVPEPSTMALLAVGMLGMVTLRRRQARK